MRFLKIGTQRISIDSITGYCQESSWKIRLYFKEGVDLPYAFHYIHLKDDTEVQKYIKWLDKELDVNEWVGSE